MRAYVREAYGGPDVLELREVDKPSPGPVEILVEVYAASVNMADLDYLLGRPRIARLGTGLRAPRNSGLGLDLAGIVTEVGEQVTRFQPGEMVFGDLTEHGFGAFAEFVVASEDAFAAMPAGIGFEEAAAIPQAGVMASQALRGKRNIHPGDKVLVNGAGGNIGPFAVQIAKSFGAEVTAVDTTHKLGMLTAIGADHVVDFTREDYTKRGELYDWIVDVASFRSIFESKSALATHGVYVMVTARMNALFQGLIVGPFLSVFSRQKLGMLMWRPFNLHDIAFLTELVESGKLSPTIDRLVPFEELPQALSYQDAGLSAGKIVITFDSAR